MRFIRASAALGLALVAMQIPPTPCAAQPADGKPRPLRVLYDRRVDFPLASLTFSRAGKRLASLGATYAVGVQPQYRIVIADVATGRVVRELPSCFVLPLRMDRARLTTAGVDGFVPTRGP
jgi:hypothetical protein